MGSRHRRLAGPLVLGLLGLSLVGAPCGQPKPGPAPADVVVYGDHVPTYRQRSSGPAPEALPNPFDDTPAQAGDPLTRLVVREAPGIALPDGTQPWGHVSWAKYVLVGNYDEIGSGVFQSIADQSVGVFDSETKAFCQLDLDASVEANTSVQWMAVAEPTARQTRIYFEGFTTAGVQGYQFGYIEADLDNDTPCDPVTGWNVVGFSGIDLNCRAASQPLGCDPQSYASIPVEEQPCPSGSCTWDGLALLDPETVVLGGWLHVPGRYVVARVDGAGVLHVPDVYPVPTWKPVNYGNICFNTRPVANPIVDPTRTLPDLRFTGAYDSTCDTLDGTPGCAPHVGVCPLSGPPAGCTLGTACASSYCATRGFGGYVSCQGPADCLIGGVLDIGPCTDACLAVHPGMQCSGTDDACTQNGNCAPGATCACDRPGRSVQELRFDGTEVTATSGMFQGAEGQGTGPAGPYDSLGNLWLSTDAGELAIYHRIGAEHSYTELGNPGGSTIKPPEQTLPFENWNKFSNVKGLQIASDLYLVGRRTLQRAIAPFGIWSKDDDFKLSLGYDELPSESRKCSVSGVPCTADVDCLPSGGFCHQFRCILDAPGNTVTGNLCDDQGLSCPAGEICVEWGGPPDHKANLSSAGSPPSLWMTSGFQHNNGPKALYLERVPLSTPLPDNLSQSRPAIAWSGGDCSLHPRQCRLWLVAQKDGELRFRVRDDGFWSGWFDLPPGVGTGGAGVASDGSRILVYARTGTGSLVETELTSPIHCEPASCTWSAWQALPAAVTTASDVAATMTASGPAVCVRRDVDDKVWCSRDGGSGFGAWFVVGNLLTDGAPSITYFAPGDRIWVAVREQGTGRIQTNRIYGSAASVWQHVGPAGSLEPWQVPPAIVASGGRVQVFTAKTGFPEKVHQSISTGGTWGEWRPLTSRSAATSQPAAADVSGDVNLVTYWFTAGAQQVAVE